MATSIRLAPEYEERLNRLAAQTGRTKAYYLRELIEGGIDDLEDIYLAEQRLIEVRAGRSQTVPLEDVIKRYGVED
mgnify:CR=1 FL=1